jgi:glycosyltransferase involved in cell wall biosynthesis
MPRGTERRSGITGLPLHGLQVAHVLPWQLVGGVEQGTLRVCEALRRAGASCTAFCVGNDSPVHALFRDAGFEVAGYTGVEPSIRRPRPFLASSRQLREALRRRDIGVVHCGDLLAGYYAAAAGRAAGARVLCHVRGEFPDISRRDSLVLATVQHFVFVSHHTSQVFGKRVRPADATVLYDGIEVPPKGATLEQNRIAVRAELGIPDGVPIVGMIARVAPGKDYETLSRAAKRVETAGGRAVYVIVGDNSFSEVHRTRYRELDSHLRATGMRDRFAFTGFRTDVQRLIRAMDVVVLITVSEGLPLVLLEAMAEGKPVVATRVGGVPELLSAGSGGELHEPGDDAGLAGRLLPLLLDTEARLRAGNACRIHVEASFSQARFEENVIRLYQAQCLRRRLRPVGGSSMPVAFPTGIHE